MLRGIIVGVIYIPTLASLGMIGVSFSAVLGNAHQQDNSLQTLQIVFGAGIAGFLLCTTAISRYLVYPKEYEKPRKVLQPLLVIIGGVNLLLILFLPSIFYFTVFSVRFLKPVADHRYHYEELVSYRIKSAGMIFKNKPDGKETLINLV